MLSRQEAARFNAALAKGLGDGGRVTLQLGSSTLELSVASQVDCQLEVPSAAMRSSWSWS
jgi:amphi-Trp domain-containing protein